MTTRRKTTSKTTSTENTSVEVANDLEAKEQALAEKEALLDKLMKELEEQKKALEVANTTKVETVKEKPNKRKQIDRNEMIKVRNVTSGALVYKSQKTGLTTVWDSYGSEEWIDFGELLTMKASQPKFLTKPWVFIDDEDVVEYLGLKGTYEKIIPVDELDDFFLLDPNEIAQKLELIPMGTRDLIASKARHKIESGKLYDVRVIKVLEDKLKVDLSLFTE